jgi:hypothetical protein
MVQVPKIVNQRLQATEVATVHPDPNLLSAFVERSLRKHEQVQVLEHLSRCTGCREIVSLAASPSEIAGAVSGVSASPAWFSWPVLRWGVVAACVIVVGAVTLRYKQDVPQIGTTIAEKEPAAEAQPRVPNTLAEQSAQRSTKRVSPAPLTSSTSGTSETMFAKTASQKKAITANPADGDHAVGTPNPVEMADARIGSAFAEVVPGRAKDASPESQSAEAEKATSGTSVKKRMATAGAAREALIPSNLGPRWTLNSDGTIQRSLDSGRTWQTIPVSGKTIFRALAANGLDIWVGGSAAALFHSSDAGRHWTQVRPAANGEALTDDIIGVEFTDTLHGKLTTASEEIWITSDAGETWQKQ